jgi:hypothetical protein
MSTGDMFSMVPRGLMRKIVFLVSKGMADQVEGKLKALAHFSEASTATREAAMGVMGYVMSLAPVRAVSTSTLLERMSHRDFAAEVVRTALRQSSALMPRIADLAASETGAAVADALHGRLFASIRGATVNGERMYGDDDVALEGHTTDIIRLLKEKRFEKPDLRGKINGFQVFIVQFLNLPVPKRIEHMLRHGPMCIWDVSHVANFSFACSVLNAKGPVTFHSDLFWETSGARVMNEMFFHNSEFRGDMSTWDVREVRDMDKMFCKAGIEDSGIGSWDVRSLETARHMFTRAMSLSPSLKLSRWNMQHCKDLSFMFSESSITDNQIGTWTLLETARTRGMFEGATKFRGVLSAWLPTHRDVAAAPDPSKEAANSFGAVQSQDDLIRGLFADAMNKTGKEAGCAVQ